MTDLGDYYNFYLLTNVLLLADVFQNFREVCLQHYGLDPAHNYTSPCLSLQVALKMMDMELDLLTDINQHLFIEEGIRRGSNDQPPIRPSQRPWHKNCDASNRNSYIMCLDANNLYGLVMTQPLSTCNFK